MSVAWARVEEIFLSALQQEPDARRAHLDAACGGDAPLRAEVESLLASHERARNFIEVPAAAFIANLLPDSFADSTLPASSLAGRRIGHYRIEREIDHGGMGTVFLARRSDDEYQKQVAIKIIRGGADDRLLLQRFLDERQILADLDHPNIARLIDGGATEDGWPYFVMDYIEGVRIDEYCDRAKLSTVERLRLFRDVCAAVQFAHQNLVVHRDIKPSNILVTPNGTPKLLDFGIAKLLSPNSAPSSERTATLARIMTPQYASPEQVRGANITTESDIYSLGVLLYKLLTGHHPYHFKTLLPTEIERVICETDPEKPSTMITRREEQSDEHGATTSSITPETVGLARGEQPEYLRRRLRGDLDAIVLMAMRKEPRRRYASVAQFSEDIRRHLEGLPVLAHEDTLDYRAGKFIRRNKIAVGATALVLLSLVIGLAVALWQTSVARTERDRAERRFADVRRLSNALLFDIAPKIERLEGSMEARESLVSRALEYLDSLAQEAGDDAGLQSELAAAYEKVGDLQGAPRRPNLSDFSGAIASYEKARNIRQRLLEKNPDDFENQTRLAANLAALSYVRWWSSDISDALVDSEKAVEIYDRLLAERPPTIELRLAAEEARIDLANIHYFNEQIPKVYPPLHKAVATLETLKQTNPENVETLRLLGRGYTNLGMTLFWDTKQKESEATIEKALAMNESLVAAYPNDNVLKQGLLYTYLQSSQLYQEDKPARSIEILLKALKVARESIARDAANTQARQHLAKTYSMLGLIPLHINKPDEAVPYLEAAAAEFASLERIDPKNRTYRHDIGRVLTLLGQAKHQQRRFTDALASYEKAVASFENEMRRDPKNNSPVRRLAAVHTYIGDTHRDSATTASGHQRQSHLRAAKENYQRALDIFLQLQAQDSLAEKDHKYLEEVRAALRKYD